jgi:hypothetical protein
MTTIVKTQPVMETTCDNCGNVIAPDEEQIGATFYGPEATLGQVDFCHTCILLPLRDLATNVMTNREAAAAPA